MEIEIVINKIDYARRAGNDGVADLSFNISCLMSARDEDLD